MALDQIVFTARDRVKERSQHIVTAKFRDRATGSTTPTTVHYRLDCLATGIELKDWTSVSPASSVNITVTPTENAIQYDGSTKERKQLTVQTDRSLSTQFTETFEYDVVNVYGFTT